MMGMKRFSYGIAAAILTFVVGVGAVSALVLKASPEPPSRPPAGDAKTLEMVFVLDTTGSMGGLIEGAKQRIWGIINEVMQTPAHPAVRVGLVAYRDHGDQYVTQVLPLTNDLAKAYTTLIDYCSAGGWGTREEVGSGRPRGRRAQSVHVGPAVAVGGGDQPRDG